MAGIGIYLVAAVLLVGAGAAKAARPGDTARALIEVVRHEGRPPRLSLRVASSAVRLLAGAEAVLGVAAIVFPITPLAALVAASYVAFAAFVLYARARGGPLATCGCFGSPDTPPTLTHAVVNLCLAAGAVGVAIGAGVATGAGAGAGAGVRTLAGVLSAQPYGGIPLLVASAVAAGLAFAVLSPLARLDALRHFDPTGVRR